MMKKVQTLFFLSFLLSLSPDLLVAQHNDNWLEKNDPIPYAKLYLHTDREYYFQGDTIWFKVYYLEGQSQQFISGFYNLYVDLIDAQGQPIVNQVVPISNGLTSGDIEIPASITEGNYLFRAYTDCQKLFGEDAFYYKTLNVSKVRSSIEMGKTDSVRSSQKDTLLDVKFLPEGGSLLSGLQNTVGVKAIDGNGKGISVRGLIINSKEQVIAFFTTEYKGMGQFFFTPKEGETYRVRIEGYPDYSFTLTDIVHEGIKLELIRESKTELRFMITANTGKFEGKEFYYAIMHHGKVLFYQKILQTNKNSQIKIDPSNLPAGINRAVLLDEQFKPISERLFFSKNYDIKKINLNLDKAQYETRTLVQLDLHEEDTVVDQSFSFLSLAVVNENSVRAYGPSVNIRSWLLIDSELKGNIESPSDYFTDEETIRSEDKLNLLMLTQGWSRYLWNTIPNNAITGNLKLSQGITISGRVKRLFSKNPVVDGEIVLGIFKDNKINTYQGKTDSEGKFSIDNIFFTDTASVFIQARNNKGRLSTEVILDPIFTEGTAVSKNYLQTSNDFMDLPIEQYRQKYYSDLAMKAFIPKEGTVMLPEINVKADRIEKDDVPFRFYPKPAVSLKINEIDESYSDVLSYLQGRVPGVMVSNGQILIRGISSFQLSSAPLFVVDGMPILTGGPAIDSTSGSPLSTPPDYIMRMPMSMIDRIEVYKSPNELAVFGMNGCNGVIAIYTKQGGDIKYNDNYTKGAIASTIIGYAGYREFYSPKYTAENIDSKRPDNRITLYWNPNVITENGKASLSFFSSDDLANYKIFVEGITNDGRVCIGTAEFAVNEYNENSSKK